jgi:hypothetical protein
VARHHKFSGDEHGNVKQPHDASAIHQSSIRFRARKRLEADLVLLAMGFLGPVKNG